MGGRDLLFGSRATWLPRSKWKVIRLSSWCSSTRWCWWGDFGWLYKNVFPICYALQVDSEFTTLLTHFTYPTVFKAQWRTDNLPQLHGQTAGRWEHVSGERRHFWHHFHIDLLLLRSASRQSTSVVRVSPLSNRIRLRPLRPLPRSPHSALARWRTSRLNFIGDNRPRSVPPVLMAILLSSRHCQALEISPVLVFVQFCALFWWDLITRVCSL